MSDYIRIYRGFKISVSCVELATGRYAVEWAATPDTDAARDQMDAGRIHIEPREEQRGSEEDVLRHVYELAERFVDEVISRAPDAKS
jgi:hypothetical protein